jgi:hypothetical protein
MGWNYRVMRHAPDPAKGLREPWYAIHEVYYRNDEVDDLSVGVSETEYTHDPITVSGGDLDELRWMLDKMREALEKPVLDYQE